MDVRRIRKAEQPPQATFRAAASKSVTHRALIAAAFADGTSVIQDPLNADDTCVTRDALVALGVNIRSEPRGWIVEGGGGPVRGGAELFLAESGTSLRFLLAVAATGTKPSTLDGAPRLRERPVQELATVLERLGGRIVLGPSLGGLPVQSGGVPMSGGSVRLPADRSSQFASALLLIAPTLPGGLDLVLEPPAVSLPYVRLTESVLTDFGARVRRVDELHWRVRPGALRGREYRVEGDHSSASYFLAAAALLGGSVRIESLRPDSAQPDARLARILDDLGCDVKSGADWIEIGGSGHIPGFELDMAEAPDLVPTMAILGLFAEGPCSIHGVAHLRLKESDRLAVLAHNLRALGRPAETAEDGLSIGPPGDLHGAVIRTESDHRMAMAFAVAGLRLDGVVLDDPRCVAKSNPGFWDQFARLER